ncbi:helix-turn-helix domain-containing protein [Salmonella enterica]|uniref:LexA family protein n=1 Tax=Salmonella enterica TaxID=28901 RepID=UPI00287E43BF|nr:helix-turn-helix domain-containing protein [Salmonella enterica]
MNLASRVKHRRQDLGLTQAEVAERAGIRQQSIDAIESGKTLKPRNLLQLAEALQCDPKWLLCGGAIIPNIDLGAKRVPLISYVHAGAFATEDPIIQDENFEYVLTTAPVSGRAFALQIKGDSMVPEFREGDIVIIDPEEYPTPGEFVVAINGDQEATFKKYRPRSINSQGEEDFELIPLNPDYPTICSWERPLRIIGTMIEHRIFRRKR